MSMRLAKPISPMRACGSLDSATALVPPGRCRPRPCQVTGTEMLAAPS